MARPLPALALAGFVALAGGALTGVVQTGSGSPARAQGVTNPCTGFGVQPITLQPVVPSRFAPALGQQGADCMAWQTFIALNWQAGSNGQPDPNVPPQAFGQPNNPNPTVWMSFYDSDLVFGGSSAQKANMLRSPRPKSLLLTSVTKFDTVDLSLSGIQQAGDRKWLTSQSGELTYYDVRMNRDEYEFITGNFFGGGDLTTYAGQAGCAAQAGVGGKGGFNLPAGGGGDTDCRGNRVTYGLDQGAMEIKAAWLPLPSDGSLNYRYLTATATITNPAGQKSTRTVGLVGLHIIHKVKNADQFLWATFEQVDNSPDSSSSPPGWAAPFLPPNPNRAPTPAYTYFNPSCSKGSDPYYGCTANLLPGTPCDSSGQPAGCDPYNAPMQITRVYPVGTTANNTTAYAWSLFPAGSVFNYYRLIDVQWPSAPTPVPPGARTPLCRGDIQPVNEDRIVANTTLETFLQDKKSCMDCHQGAPIASPSRPLQGVRRGPSRQVVRPRNLMAASCGGAKAFASDYSFMFIAETRR